jgi:signal transduction histidine kinase
MKLSAETVIHNPAATNEIIKSAKKIVENSLRCDHMIQDLLDASRSKSATRLPVLIGDCDLKQISAETVKNLTTIFGPRFHLIGEGNFTGFWCSESLQRALENLCINAAKYGSQSHPISIRLMDLGDAVRIAVHNFGNPLGLDEQQRLFDRYARNQNAEDASDGWGLGLTIVKTIADAHHGTVGVASNANEGTTFTVTLPRDARKSKETQ